MRLLVKAAAFVTRRQWTRWHQLTSKPQEIQDELLLEILERNRATRFGRDHHFKSIGSLGDYRYQVAIADYERVRPYVQLVQNGERDALTAEPVDMFTMTSGSTGEPKLIPVTAKTRENHRQLTRLWYYRALVDHADLFNGKLLGVISPAVEGKTTSGFPFGAASGLIYESSPRWIKNAYAVPYQVSEIKDFEAKYYVIMRLALEQDISFFGTPNPSTILKLVQSASQNKYDIIKDIHDGTITMRFDLPAQVRASLATGMRKNLPRARRLESLIKHDGALRPKEYWPRLQLIGCWKGGSAGVRLKEFAGWFAKTTPVRDLGYMASEAQMTLPVFDSGSAGILAIDKNFYEFIPESEINSAAPRILTCSELEEGNLYYIILTTPGGLYRYDINDVIRVAGFYNQTPLIEFVRKGRDVTSITGEKLHVNQVIDAMARAQRAAGVAVQHFRACADVEKSLYVFSVELNGAASNPETLRQLLQEVDMRLRELNIEYAQKRESGRLGTPLLCVMKIGWFERRVRIFLQGGGRDTQYKAQLLCVTPEDPDEIQFVVESAGTVRSTLPD